MAQRNGRMAAADLPPRARPCRSALAEAPLPRVTLLAAPSRPASGLHRGRPCACYVVVVRHDCCLRSLDEAGLNEPQAQARTNLAWHRRARVWSQVHRNRSIAINETMQEDRVAVVVVFVTAWVKTAQTTQLGWRWRPYTNVV